MKNKKILGIVMLTLIGSVLVYMFKDKIMAMLGQDMNPDDISNPETEVSDGEPVTEGGTQSTEGGTTYAAEGCGGNYTNQLDEIAEDDPALNVGGCGAAVVAWQEFLNSVLAYSGSGVTPLNVDGKYGPATQAFHNQYLYNLPTVGRDISAPLFEKGVGASLN